ncbi:hypothetical protein E4U42_007314 [Claviceps africana]|uniref:Uncharacterized protein n=1 Tax=Claviceps africana TaxID=83212 RepID=A0A8K0NF72_9HYPO|nr:hypothetical protein E4U42_007314 [Claviceps africana]
MAGDAAWNWGRVLRRRPRALVLLVEAFDDDGLRVSLFLLANHGASAVRPVGTGPGSGQPTDPGLRYRYLPAATGIGADWARRPYRYLLPVRGLRFPHPPYRDDGGR